MSQKSLAFRASEISVNGDLIGCEVELLLCEVEGTLTARFTSKDEVEERVFTAETLEAHTGCETVAEWLTYGEDAVKSLIEGLRGGDLIEWAEKVNPADAFNDDFEYECAFDR